MNRVFGGYARRIDTPWKMYPVGVLFGLGFDTATEVALLVLAGSAVVGGLPFYAVISLPVLFAAGMCLFDTIDGCFMNFAYDWAFAKPIRKIYYNLTITGLSVFIALFIGTVEILGLIAQETNLSGGFWDFMQNFNINRAGFIIVGVFVVTWIVALAIWHFGDIERKWEGQTGRCRPLRRSQNRGVMPSGTRTWSESGREARRWSCSDLTIDHLRHRAPAHTLGARSLLTERLSRGNKSISVDLRDIDIQA